MQKQKQSNSTHDKTQSRQSRNPQNSTSIRKAAAKLKEKESQIDIIKKRFQVLKGQQEYNRYRTLDQQRRIKNHQALHQSIKSNRQSIEKQLFLQRQQQEQQLKERHDKLLQQIKAGNKDTMGELLQSRVNDYQTLKEQSRKNQDQIERNRRELMQENARKKDSVLSEEKRQKAMVNQFKNSKVREIIGNRSMEASRLTELAQAKDKQLQKMMIFEQEMLKKASQSVAMNQKLKSEFGKVFVQVKQRNSVKFPSISRQSGSYRTNHSTISRNLSIYQI